MDASTPNFQIVDSSQTVLTDRADTSSTHVSAFSKQHKTKVKCGFSTRRVNSSEMQTLITGDLKPRHGDLVIARVVRPRQHLRIELPTGRRAHMRTDDQIVVCYGNRYAPDQFEAWIPTGMGPCHLVAAGGIAAQMRLKHKLVKPATEIQPIALVGDSKGKRLNTFDYRLPGIAAKKPVALMPVIAVVGTTMNSGKTTTACQLIHGYSRLGYKVGAAKITGTGSGCDVWKMIDAGAHCTYDFTDAGHPSTYGLSASAINTTFKQLVSQLANQRCDIAVIEIADGVLQAETSSLLRSRLFKDTVEGVFFAAGDSLSALACLDWLEKEHINVLGISGVVSISPLATREVEASCRMQVLNKLDLLQPEFLNDLQASFANKRESSQVISQ